MASYKQLFDRTPTPASTEVAEVLRRGPDLEVSARAVAGEQSVDPADLIRQVKRHIHERSKLPCSWLLVRIRYAGTGEQAFESLGDLLRVVGKGEGKPVMVKHIREASALRRKV